MSKTKRSAFEVIFDFIEHIWQQTISIYPIKVKMDKDDLVIDLIVDKGKCEVVRIDRLALKFLMAFESEVEGTE